MNPSSRTLFIDTATRHVYLALVIDGIEVASVYRAGDNDHSVTIMPLLEDLLKKQNLGLRDLTDVIVGIGPGSYTGVRIGVSIAKMIGYLNAIPVASVSSLALLASGAESGVIIPFVDARRGNAFLGAYRVTGDLLSEILPDTLANVESFLSQFHEPYVQRAEGKPDALRILRSGLATRVHDVHALVPNYLQVTEAENKKAGR